jgi:uncharacterized protein
VSPIETPFFFDCEGAQLLGVLASAEGAPRTGVVIVVGGPQYRAGSHRQFTLLARALAHAGVPCLRFDYRGMGDSEGPRVTFEQIASDIRAAIDALVARVPSVERVVLWGLCDGASASAFYAASDARVAGLALFNPWVRTQEGQARTQLTHYYARRLLDPAFWRKLVSGKVAVRDSAASLGTSVREAARGDSAGAAHGSLPQRIAAALAAFRGPVLIGLSGNDAVAAEFRSSEAGGAGPDAATRVDLAGFDHTFSCAAWRDDVAARTLQWLRETSNIGSMP